MFGSWKYFSFIGISATLPTTSYIKMLDIWMLFTMVFAFTEILVQALMETSRQRMKKLAGDIQGGGDSGKTRPKLTIKP